MYMYKDIIKCNEFTREHKIKNNNIKSDLPNKQKKNVLYTKALIF